MMGAGMVNAAGKFEQDIIETGAGGLEITFIGHSTLMFTFGGRVIHVDPVGEYADYQTLPKADLILITHEHGDHLDAKVVELLRQPSTRAMLNRPGVDLHSPGIYENYFRQLYQTVNTDKHRINELRQRLDFPEVAARFKLIEDDSVPLVVRYPKKDSKVNELLRRLQAPGALLGGEARRLLRQFQPYLVNVRRRVLSQYQQQGLARELPL